MHIPSPSGQGPAAATDYYQSLYAAPSTKSTFAQTLAQTQSASLSLTTAEGDQVTLSGLSLNYQYTQGMSWFTPSSSGVNVSGSSASAEAMGLSVQGDLSEQELADITRLVGGLTSIASSFFSGDYEAAMAGAMDFGNQDLGSVSSLAASFSSQTVSQTQITSSSTLPATTADLSGLNLKDLYDTLGTDPAGTPDYAQLLEARWQQMLKALDEMKAKELDGMFARGVEPQPLLAQGLATVAPTSPEGQQPLASEPPPVSQEAAQPTDQAASVPAEERVARQMMAQMEELLADHPKVTPFAKALANTAMEKAANGTENPLPDTAKALSALQNAFRSQLHQWFFAPATPAAATPLTTV